jgi:catechol 2,3-dioxygenase-like lactoylglutathione lyase family enzyme
MQQQTNSHAAIHSIDHFALYVPSLDDADRFFTVFGLTLDRSDNEIQLSAADGHRWGRLIGGQEKSLAYLSFNCHEHDLAAIERQTRAAGGRFDIASAHKNDVGFWFHDPDGNLIQVKAGPRTMPSSKSEFHVPVVGAGVRGAHPRSTSKPVIPRRLSHVLLFTPDVIGTAAFFEQSIGLRVSDKSLDLIAFTHAPHGCDHHLVAFAKSTAKGWHHCSWDVERLDDVGIGSGNMMAAGYKKGWGTGRHVLGSNYFYYVQDPWGSFSEYSADIDYIAEGEPWPTGDHHPEDSLYFWGPDVPDYFIFNTEAPPSTEAPTPHP